MWTRFMDMRSGGGQKLDWPYIYIEAPEAEARVIFYNRFGRNPDRVTCTCCGSDYSNTESDTLEQATAFDRGCAWEGGVYVERSDPERNYRPYQTLEAYRATSGALFITADEILPEQREGEVPEQGYVWVD